MKYSCLVCLLWFFINVVCNAQQANTPFFSYKNGLGITAADSSFSMNIRFRMQNRAIMQTVSNTDLSASEVEARVRRCRLRFEGFVWNPKLTYSLQLSFSRGDMDWSGPDNSKYNTSPNVVRDAMISYKFTPNFTLSFGQGKLPGNRQRVISSGDQQFVDRSILNATLNIDRDFGLQAAYNNNFGDFNYNFKAALTSGEGRNSVSSDNGLAYTGRVEVLPFGNFENKGDYFEGDLMREKTPKLSVGAVYSFNDNAVRSGGQIGRDLFEKRDMETIIGDAVLKYRGFALSGEYIIRNAAKPVTVSGIQNRNIYVGYGENIQASYLFKNNVELAGRFTAMHPYEYRKSTDKPVTHYVLGCTQYLKGHRVKVQENIGYQNIIGGEKNWYFALQVELGI